MALPVAQIMAQLQGRGRGGDEEGMVDDEEERLGAEVASEELEVVDDEGEGQEEQNGHFEDTELDIIEGERAGTKWLIINQVHICTFDKSLDLEKFLKRNYSWFPLSSWRTEFSCLVLLSIFISLSPLGSQNFCV